MTKFVPPTENEPRNSIRTVFMEETSLSGRSRKPITYSRIPGSGKRTGGRQKNLLFQDLMLQPGFPDPNR